VRRLTLLTRPGCHLCDDARALVEDVLRGFPEVAFEERSIVGDAELEREYAEEIPVVLLDDRVHTIWRVDRDRLVRALASTASTGEG
jgi:glutaredoxin